MDASELDLEGLTDEELAFIKEVKSNNKRVAPKRKKRGNKIASNTLLGFSFVFFVAPFLISAFIIFYLNQTQAILGGTPKELLDKTKEGVDGKGSKEIIGGLEQFNYFYENRTTIIIAIFLIFFLIVGILLSVRAYLKKKRLEDGS